MRMVKTLLVSAFMSTVLSSAVFAAGTSYEVGDDVHNTNEVKFTSNASIVQFYGTTSDIQGTANVDLNSLTKSTGEIKVSLATFDTRKPQRNEHMKKVLNTDVNQFAVFKLKELKTGLKTLPAYKAVMVNAIGDLSLNNITKPINTMLEITYMPEKDKNSREGDWIHLATNFEIKLSDYGIKAPRLIPLKVNDVLKIDVNVMGMKK
mgnify:CR=1 FL=1